jgi:cytochrome c peroxidase
VKKFYVVSVLLLFIIAILSLSNAHQSNGNLDNQLYAVLQNQGFTGEIQRQLEIKLGRRLDKRKIELGRLIFFDKGLGLHQDNTCAGCHAPGFGFGDSQPIAIGVDNNDTVGVHRKGPRNQRRTPSVINTAFFPSLMWNSRFKSLTNDPFNNSLGFEFPPPEGDSLFSISYNYVRRAKHLLVAQAHIPFTELPEMAGFTSTANTTISFSRFSGLTANDNAEGKTKPMLFNKGTTNANRNITSCQDPDFSVFDDGHGLPVPPIDPHYNSSNFGIRAEVLDLLNNNAEYVRLFRRIYPEVAYKPIDFIMVGEVVAEFEFFLTFAVAPLDKFAAGNSNAMSESQKRGALIFFGKGNCVSCHAVSGSSNQMFSDFAQHNVGTPQIYPVFGFSTGNVPFSDINCPNKTATGTLDFGREEFTGNIADRYKFRSSPLRNAKLQSSFFHNGSFKDLKKAIKYHLDPTKNIRTYSPNNNGVPVDLKYKASDMPNVMATIDPVLRNGIRLSENEINDLYIFVRDGLYDDKASPDKMNALIPRRVPSGVKVAFFEGNEIEDDRFSGFVNSSAAKGADEKTDAGKTFSAKLLSNPTQNAFSLVLSGGEVGVKTKMIITDLNGKIVETRNFINEGQTINFGQDYKKGIFFLELTQGQKKITFKLIKL